MGVDAGLVRVLVVDDDSVIQMQVAQDLEEKGYVPLCAGGGQEGVDVAVSERPDLIILDRRMPGMDGNQTLIHLKSKAPQIR